MPWVSRGPAFNSWWTEFRKLTEAMLSVEGHYWWIYDTDLKYLNIRLDTRDLGFVLTDREGVQIDPQRVLDAIEKYKERMVKK